MRSRLTEPKVAVSVVFVLAIFISIMDVTIVNVALPQLGRDLHVGASGVAAVAIGYLVSLAVGDPGQRLARRPVRRQTHSAHRHRDLHPRVRAVLARADVR